MTAKGRAVRRAVRNVALLVGEEKLLVILALLYLALAAIDRRLPEKSLSYMNARTLSIIISLMLISKNLELSGVFERVSVELLERTNYSQNKSLLIIIFLVIISSMIIMNDTALFVFIPLAVTMSRYFDEPGTVLVLVTMAANVGSSLTPIGNPQNIIIWRSYDIGFLCFVKLMLPFFVISSGLLLLYSLVIHRGRPPSTGVVGQASYGGVDRKRLLVSSVLLVVVVVLSELGMEMQALLVTVLVCLAACRDVFYLVDYVLIILFTLIFIDFNEISYLLEPMLRNALLENDLRIILVAVATSQAISNVPATILLVNHVPASKWLSLAIGVNLGGLGLLIGSMANIIAVRLGGLDPRVYHEKALPYFAVLTLIVLAVFGLR